MGTFVANATIGLVGYYANADGLTVPTGVNTPNALLNYSFARAFTSGTGASQANWIYAKSVTLLGASEAYDFFGSLTDRYGATINAVKVKGIIVVNHTLTTLFSLAVTGLVTATVGPGGFYANVYPVDGITVTATSADSVTLNPGSNTIEADLLIWGTM